MNQISFQKLLYIILKYFFLSFILVLSNYNVHSQNEGLDLTFSDDGIASIQFTSNDEQIRGMAIQNDGKLVVTGYSDNGFNYDIGVARFKSDGTLDSSFSGDGKAIVDFGSMDIGYCAAIQSDGKIVISGKATISGSYDFAVVRFNSNGTLDNTFSGDGKATTSIGSTDNAYCLAIQDDGKILLAGYSHMGIDDLFSIVRYNTDGTLDNTFSTDGKVTTAIGSSSDYIFGIGIQSDGRIVVAGYSNNGSNFDIAVARYNSDGTLDNTFSIKSQYSLSGKESSKYLYSLP